MVVGAAGDLSLLHRVNPFNRTTDTAGTAYFRLLGIASYHYRYTDADLAGLHRWCASRVEVFCFFNNMTMLRDAEWFRKTFEGAA